MTIHLKGNCQTELPQVTVPIFLMMLQRYANGLRILFKYFNNITVTNEDKQGQIYQLTKRKELGTEPLKISINHS
jgi:hypothetical protein